MMDKEKALTLLDLQEGSSEQQIKARFSVLLKKHKSEGIINIDLITDAYNFLLDFEKIEGLDKESKNYKFRRFLFHYLSYILIGAMIVGWLLWLILPKLTEEKYDFYLSFVGSYYLLEEETVEEMLLNEIKEVTNPLVEIIYLDEDTTDVLYDEAGRVKLAGTISTKEADILILDDENFVFLLRNDILMPLDDILPLLDVTIDESLYIKGISEQDGSIHIYGIDVSRDARLLETVYGNIIRIFTIAKETKRFDQVIQASNLLLKEVE